MRSEDEQGNAGGNDVESDDVLDAEEERPYDAVDCPRCGQDRSDPDCPLCEGRRWVREDEIDVILGENRVPCLVCGGAQDGPDSETCLTCLGTGRMPVAALAELELADYPVVEQSWRRADLSGMDLRGGVFRDCNFSRVNFAGADLSGVSFIDCNFKGANPEWAASLAGTRLAVWGLSRAQVGTCLVLGATLVDDEDEDEDG
jgi:hypothetical protein